MDQDAPMTPEEAEAFIAAHEWTFAKSMPQWPHWYVVRQKCRDREEFFRFVRFIRSHGYVATFYPYDGHRGFKRHYIDIGDHHYWTQGSPVPDTTIINRGLHPNIAKRA